MIQQTLSPSDMEIAEGQNIKISLFNNVSDNHSKDTTLSREELVQRLTTFTDKLYTKSTAPAFISGHFGGNNRKTENLESRNLITLDLDSCNIDLTALEQVIEDELKQYRYIAYTTSSHTYSAPKIRIVLFLAKEVKTVDYKTVASNFINSLDKLKGYLDIKASTTACQLMFLPFKSSLEYQPWCIVSEGEDVDPYLFNVKSIVAEPKAENDNLVHVSANILSITLSDNEIDNYLSQYPVINCNYDEWIEVGMALHQQYQGNDQGKLLWRQWSSESDIRYKADEIDVKWDTFASSKAKPKTFASIIQKVRCKNIGQSSALSRRPNIIWVDLTQSKHPTPKSTIENVKLLLDAYNTEIRFNQITHKRDVTWGSNCNIANNYQENDREANDIARIKSLCERHSIKSQCLIDNAINVISNENAYNPFKDIVENIQWDGISRLNDFYDTITVDIIHEDIKKVYLKKWLSQMLYLTCLNDNVTGLVGRQVLVFQGKQHIGKTTWFKSLLPKHLHNFLIDGVKLDLNNDMSVKSCIEHIFVELGELGSTFRKSDQDSLKAFISKSEDSINVKYLANHQTFRRRTSFFASVNDRNFLQDKTGNSRFLVLPVLSINYNKVDMLQLYAELLIHAKAEQYRREQAGNDTPEYELTKEEAKIQSEINDDYTSISPIAELIDKHFDFADDPATYDNHMLAIDILNTIDYSPKTKKETNEVGQILDLKGVRRGNSRKGGFYLPSKRTSIVYRYT